MTLPTETYLDHAASAPLLPEAREAVLHALDAGPGNASSAHGAGRRLRRLLGDAREQVAGLVGARPEQVVFTSGTTESNRLAVRGLLGGLSGAARVLVHTAADHDSLRALAARMAREGVDVRAAPARGVGHIAVPDVLSLAPAGSCVVTLPLVESVTGAIQPVKEIAAALPAARVHVDAAQAVGRVPVAARDLGAATLSFSGHKIGGPQGVGVLVVRSDHELASVDGDASQERGRRAGTEAVALAAGMGAAAAIAAANLAARDDADRQALEALRAWAAATDGVTWISAAPCVAGTALVRFHGCPGDAVSAALDARGFRVSTGTACASGARTPPHVLTSCGWSARDAAECVRVSVGPETAVDDVERLVDALRDVVPRVRAALAPATARDQKKL